MVEFWKYEGLGNDLVFFRGRPDVVTPGWISRVCDRHLGVGADGIMYVEHTPDSKDRALIHYFNADGSPSEMCGNGLRCAVLFLHGDGHAPAGEMFSVQFAGSGRRRCTVLEGGASIEVEMGRPERGKGAEGSPDRMRLDVEGRDIEILPLSIGNPHAVIFEDLPRADMEVIGPSLERNRLFPDRVNVEFAVLRAPNVIDLVVWERGCGFTQACGSGACATATAATWEGLCDPETSVEVRLPGGSLHVRLDSDGVVWLRGPARRVFSGNLEPSDF